MVLGLVSAAPVPACLTLKAGSRLDRLCAQRFGCLCRSPAQLAALAALDAKPERARKVRKGPNPNDVMQSGAQNAHS